MPLCRAQDTESVSVPANAKPVPAFQQPTLFPLDSAPLAKSFNVEVRTPDQMTEKDRLLEADAESSIAERAGFVDLQFNAGKWSYQQLVCPDFPNHLFLRFTRDNGEGDRSVFSASIPRGGEGHVRIIPILRRSYSLFSPAPINEITIAAFNHIRNEENAESEPSWVGTALCYAALAGTNPVAVPLGDASLTGGFPAASAPELEIALDGEETIHFADASAKPRPMEWEMTFNKKGRLLKVQHPVNATGKPRLIPAGAPPEERPIPAGTQPEAKPVPGTVAAN